MEFVQHMWWWAVLVTAVVDQAVGCPSVCQCNQTVEWGNETLYLTNCSGNNLNLSPYDIPPETEYLDLSGNSFWRLNYTSVDNISNLVVVDTRDNPNLRHIPMTRSMLAVDTLWTDKGSTCCIYEINWRKNEGWDSEAYKMARDSCVATEPYEECREDLINVTSLTLYTTTLVLSLILNPWVILVDLLIPQRRRDPYILVMVHFSITNIFMTFYAAMFTGYGFLYLDKYQYYMDDWMQNPVCTVMGFVLVTSSLQFSFLCMMIVIHFYLNIKHPLERQRQFTAKRLHIAVLITWGMAVFIAVFPFMTGEHSYNNVAQCLPFYASADAADSGFTFAILYTLVETISLVVIVTLTGIIVNSFIRQNRRIQNQDNQNTTEERIVRENRSVRNAILSKVAGFIVFSIVLDTLLILSCIDNNEVAILGREWFSRLCVLQAVFWPLIGSFKHKRFYKDTKRLFQLWNCYDWDRDRITMRRRTTTLRPTDNTQEHTAETNINK